MNDDQPPAIRIGNSFTDDHGGWAYTTFIADADELFWPSFDGETPDESANWGWFTLEEMKRIKLHPGFKNTLPKVAAAEREAIGKQLRRVVSLNGQESWVDDDGDKGLYPAAGGGSLSTPPVPGGVPGFTAGAEPPRWDGSSPQPRVLSAPDDQDDAKYPDAGRVRSPRPHAFPSGPQAMDGYWPQGQVQPQSGTSSPGGESGIPPSTVGVNKVNDIPQTAKSAIDEWLNEAGLGYQDTGKTHHASVPSTASVFSRLQIAPDVLKVGKEGYIHGFICVRPPCGPAYTEAKFDGKKGTVSHGGKSIGKMRKNADGTYSMTHVSADGTRTKLSAAYPTRAEAALSVVNYHDVSKLSDAASGRTKEHLDAAKQAMAAGDHDTAVKELKAAEFNAATSDDDGIASHIAHVRATVTDEPAVEPKPVSTGSLPATPVAISDKYMPSAVTQPFGDGYTLSYRNVGTSSAGKGVVHEFSVTDPSGKYAANAVVYDKGGHVVLDQLATAPDEQGHGLGGKLLDMITSSFPDKDVRLKAEPYGDKSLSEAQLQSFYGKHGFIPDGNEMVLRHTAAPSGEADENIQSESQNAAELRNKLYDGWVNQVKPTPGELSTLQEYTENSEAVNKALRGVSGNHDEMVAFSHDLDNMASRYQLPQTVQVYRGARIAMPADSVGKTMTDKGFTSTSFSPDVAKFYTTEGYEPSDAGAKPVMFRITAPAGTHGIMPEPVDPDDEEFQDAYEFILPRGTSFKVIGATPQDDHTLYDAVVVPGDETKPATALKPATVPKLAEPAAETTHEPSDVNAPAAIPAAATSVVPELATTPVKPVRPKATIDANDVIHDETGKSIGVIDKDEETGKYFYVPFSENYSGRGGFSSRQKAANNLMDVLAGRDRGNNAPKPVRHDKKDTPRLTPPVPGDAQSVEGLMAEGDPMAAGLHPGSIKAAQRLGDYASDVSTKDLISMERDSDITGIGPDSSRQAALNAFLQKWNDAGTAKSSFVQAFQKAVQDEFGLKSAYMGPKDFTPAAKKLYAAHGATLRKMARAQYNSTQDALKAAGIKNVLVHRGMGWKNAASAPSWLKNSDGTLAHGEVFPQQRPISSWTTSMETADNFISAMQTSGGKEGVILSADVPASRVFSLPGTGIGDQYFKEVVLLDSPGSVRSG